MIRFVLWLIVCALVFRMADIALSDENTPNSAKAKFNYCMANNNGVVYCVTGLKVGQPEIH